jgi:hypothetical protein
MSLPDPSAARKPNRWPLYAPFLLLLAAAVAWSCVWVWERGRALAALDAAQASWRTAGFQLAWKGRSIGGYPFRLDVTLTDASLREPSGWALRAPRIEAEAFAYAPTHWLIAATEGLTFTRPRGGPVNVSGDLIRASLSHPGALPPSLSFEGVKLRFATPAGAEPFALTTADRVEFHLRAGPDDEAGVFATLTNGNAEPSGLFGRIAGDRPVSLDWNATTSKMSGFGGRDWAEAVRHWMAGGGRMTVRKASLTLGEAQIAVNSGTLGAGADGRLTGALDVRLRRAPWALGVLNDEGVIAPEAARAANVVVQAGQEAAGDTAHTTINFLAGKTTLGPVALGPAPPVYRPD